MCTCICTYWVSVCLDLVAFFPFRADQLLTQLHCKIRYGTTTKSVDKGFDTHQQVITLDEHHVYRVEYL
jgi:hypothetical protein